MTEARRLLVETNLPVEVSLRIGYGDAGCFVRTFRGAHNGRATDDTFPKHSIQETGVLKINPRIFGLGCCC